MIIFCRSFLVILFMIFCFQSKCFSQSYYDFLNNETDLTENTDEDRFDMGQLIYGLKYGPQINGFRGEGSVRNGEKSKLSLGFVAGLTMAYSFTSQWFVDVELLFSKRGAQWGSLKREINYFEVPLSLRYH